MRDHLLGHPSSEVDIATNASPEEVQALFEKTIPVGIAFGVVIVVLDGENFEVATFRKDHPYQDGRHPEGVDFSSPEHDAQRRDFTINGMFYDPLTKEVFDYVRGKEDLKRCIIRAIGDPKERFEEDRLRMIRAVRFAARFGFRIEEKTAKAIQEKAHTLFPAVSMERVWQEFTKLHNHSQAFVMLHRYGLLPTIFPQLKNISIEEIEKRAAPFDRFPKNCPTILYLREILEETTDIVPYLKASNQDQKLLDYFATECEDLYDWSHFYANPYHTLYLEIEVAKGHSINAHEERMHKLKKYIGKKPAVDSALLMQHGIRPSPLMGELLEKAARIEVNEGIDDPQEILRRIELL